MVALESEAKRLNIFEAFSVMKKLALHKLADCTEHYPIDGSENRAVVLTTASIAMGNFSMFSSPNYYP